MKKVLSVMLSFCMIFTFVSSVSMTVFADGNASDVVLLGDVDNDSEVTILDATFIQRYLARIAIPFELNIVIADADGDGDVTILDATSIQRFLVGLKTNENIGKPVGEESVEDAKGIEGTWNLLPQNPNSDKDYYDYDYVSVTRDEAIQSFTLSKDGMIEVNGKQYSLQDLSESDYYIMPSMMMFKVYSSFHKAFDMTYSVDIEGEYYLLFICKEFDDFDFVALVPTRGYAFSPIYARRELKTVELSLDNWQEFFDPEIKISYSLYRDDWGDPVGICWKVYLSIKDDMDDKIIFRDEDQKDGSIRAKYKLTPCEYSTICFTDVYQDGKITEYTMVNRREYELDGHNVYDDYLDFDEDNNLILYETMYDEGFGCIDGVYSAHVDADYYFEINRIRGTVTYLE